MKHWTPLIALFALAPSGASGQVLFSEPFDSNAAAVSQTAGADSVVTFVDYSNFTVGGTMHNVPEAPNRIGGSAATRGVLLQSNLAGTPSPINLTAPDGSGGTPLTFSGTYRLTFDVYLSVADPIPAGGTEQVLWGIGTSQAEVNGRVNRAGGVDGTWGWLATENGYGTDDATIFEGTTEVADLSDGDDPAFFENAFGGNSPFANTPANNWTQVDVNVFNGNVTVRYNGVEFFSIASSQTSGFALAGYEDPFGSISGSPDFQWGLIDNMVVQVPEPATYTSILGLGVVALTLARRRARR